MLCGRVPLRHALVLNVQLNHGPGHRSFEVMAAGVAQPERLRAIPVAPPPYWELKDLL